jgi:hypothetical protein
MSEKPLWDRFQSDMSELGDRLRDAYQSAPTEGARAELKASVDRLQEAAEAVFKSIDHVAKDPQVRAGTRRAAKSFGDAVGETFRQVADSLRSKKS